MKNVWIIIGVITSLCLCCTGVSALLDPSAVYCGALNYSYVIENTPAGQVGYCVLSNGMAVDSWKFLKGTEAVEYSYCTKAGYTQKTVTDPEKCGSIYGDTCNVCVMADGKEIEVAQAMGLTFREPNLVVQTTIPLVETTTPKKTPVDFLVPPIASALAIIMIALKRAS